MYGLGKINWDAKENTYLIRAERIMKMERPVVTEDFFKLSKPIYSRKMIGFTSWLMRRGKKEVLATIQRVIKYRFGKAERLRKNLNAPFLPYHLKYLRLYLLGLYLEKLQYRLQGLCIVNIETTAFCNRKCDFCFNNDRFPKREQGLMQEEVYKKVIDELAEKNFRGRLSPHFYGEPLLDTRLPTWVEYTRMKLPLCFIAIRTNGDFFNEDLFINLLDKGADHFLITNYDDEEKPLLKSLATKYPIHITFQSYKDFPKVDKAGEIFKIGKSLSRPCLRPASCLVINWKGNVLLCCQDFYEAYCFGNIREENLWEIWNGRQFVDFRNHLRLGHRSCFKTCVNCDDGGEIPW